MLEQMLTCYKTYVAANSSPVDSVNMLIIGFEGRLKRWLALLQKKEADLLTEWAKTVVLNEQGQPQLLANGSQENNYISKLISAITHEYIGQYIDTTQIQTMALTQMRLKRLTEFHAYFEEYQRRLFLLPSALAPSWKLHFISTLPKWFSDRLLPAFKGSVEKETWGSIQQGVLGTILTVCKEHQQIRNVSASATKANFAPLCKQYHVGFESSSKSSRGAGLVKKKKGKNKWKNFNNKPHKDKETAKRKYREEKRKSNRRKAPEHIKCFICGGNHYKTVCSKLIKEKMKVQKQIGMLEEQLHNLEISSSEQSESERSSEGESDSVNIDMIQFDGSTSSDCECTDSDNCECNVLTIDEENDLYRALLNTKDNIARKVIQEKLNQKREEPNNKVKNKIDPSAFLHTSIQRNTAQFRVKTIDEFTDMASVSNAIKDLRNRVKHLDDLVNKEY